jgi:signal transduction histidine kinase
VATGIIAVSFAPLRNALQSGVDRLVYRQWSRPADVLAAAGRRVSDAPDVHSLIAAFTEDLRSGLGMRHVEILDADGKTVSVAGTPGTDVEVIPLVAYNELVGSLRWSGRALRDSDRQLLADVAHQIGGIAYSSRLVEALRDAQERLVLAHEDERRRLRRDLHDGLGAALAGLTLQVDTVRNLLARADSGADDALVRLRTGIQSTVQDVRRIVEGLRPPSLDELGLVNAIQELAQRLGASSGVSINVYAPAQLPALAAAAEVAAYRVVQEALTNAVRHAQASTCTVHVEIADDELLVRIQDDGNGRVVVRSGGVGLASMHERATEIGGTLMVSGSQSSGTTVLLRLPIDATTTQVPR